MSIPSLLSGKLALVTGAASGIGAATALQLAREGFQVACLDRDEGGLDRTLHALGPGHRPFALDLCDEQAVAAVFAEIARWHGRIDGLATCAGVVDTTAFDDLSVARLFSNSVTYLSVVRIGNSLYLDEQTVAAISAARYSG